MKNFLAKWERRYIRYRLSQSTPDELIRLGERKLIRSFQRAAKSSPAYRVLLAEAQVDPRTIRTPADFVARCPILEKCNTFQRFGLKQLLVDDVRVADLASILTSSGHGSGGFALGLSTRAQCSSAPWLIDLGLELAFDIDRFRTLLINCLPMGVAFQSDVVCVANVSVREDMACAIVKQAGELFDQIILCGDPLFLKRLCDYSQATGVDWARYRVHVIIGEETFSESFRNYLSSVLHGNPDAAENGLIGSSMGVGELGLNLFSETKETIALRRACQQDRTLLFQLVGAGGLSKPLPTFFTFNPLRTFVEIVNPDGDGVGNLVISVMDLSAPVPLLRYCTGDRAQIIAMSSIAGIAARVAGGLSIPTLPVVALHGRVKDELPRGGHVDHFKEALYRKPELARHTTGAFRLTDQGDGDLLWEIQMTRESDLADEELARELITVIEAGVFRARIRCYSYMDFPYGRTLDYERKFVYWLAP